MTLTIPTWVLWTIGLAIGIPATIVLVFLACVGVAFIRSMDTRWGPW